MHSSALCASAGRPCVGLPCRRAAQSGSTPRPGTSAAAPCAALPPGLEDLAADPVRLSQAAAAAAAAGHGGSGAGGGGWWAAQPSQLLLTTSLAYVAAGWPGRPRGWCNRELVEVRDSGLAGRGVFAAAGIPAGTVLGAYPGRPRPPADMLAKAARAPGAKQYAFRTREGLYLDPTDLAGAPSPWPAPGLPWPLAVDASMAFINEPPPGGAGCNVGVEDDPSDPASLLCVAARSIAAGEELLMDYGISYDRSGYVRQEQQSSPPQQPPDER